MAKTSKTVSKTATSTETVPKTPVKKVAKTTVDAKAETKSSTTKEPKTTASKKAAATPVKATTKEASTKDVPKKTAPKKVVTSASEAPATKIKEEKPAMAKTAPKKVAASQKEVEAPIKKSVVDAKKAASTTPEKPKRKPKKEEKPAVLLSAREEIADAFVEKSTLSNNANPNVVVPSRGRSKATANKETELIESPFATKPRSILDEPDMESQNRKRYSDDDLTEFKELILGRLEKARKELFYLQGLITRKDEAGTEDTDNRFNHSEDGSGAMEREQLSQLAGRQIQFINHLEKAIVRIENKTYGICRVTGELIDKARLRAVPHATLSIEAKNSQKK